MPERLLGTSLRWQYRADIGNAGAKLLHHAHVVQIRGDSYRLKDKRKSGIIGQQIPVMQTED